MGIILISGKIISPQAGVDITKMEGLKSSLYLFEPRHFIMPFFAHILVMLVGTLVAVGIAANHKMNFAFVLGVWFLLGGIMNILMLSSP